MGVVFEHAMRTTIIIRVAKQFGKMDLRTGLVVVVLILATGGWSGTDREQPRGWISRHPLCGLKFTPTALDKRVLEKKYGKKKFADITFFFSKMIQHERRRSELPTRFQRRRVGSFFLIFETPINTTRTSRASTAN